MLPLGHCILPLGHCILPGSALGCLTSSFVCYQAELAAQLLEEEWPDEDEVRAARMAVREEATPVPERAWALRNVASTLALGGPGERARARTLLEKAVTLKEQWLDDVEHPGMVLITLILHAYYH